MSFETNQVNFSFKRPSETPLPEFEKDACGAEKTHQIKKMKMMKSAEKTAETDISLQGVEVPSLTTKSVSHFKKTSQDKATEQSLGCDETFEDSKDQPSIMSFPADSFFSKTVFTAPSLPFSTNVEWLPQSTPRNSVFRVPPPTPKKAPPAPRNSAFRVPPPTPNARARRSQKADNVFRRAADCNGFLFHRSIIFPLTYLGNGDYKTVFTIPAGQPKFLINGPENNALVIKTYSSSRAREHTDRALKMWTEHSMEQYAKILAHNKRATECNADLNEGERAIAILPVANIYNNPVEDGYFVTDYFSDEWNDTSAWERKEGQPLVAVEDLSAVMINRLEQYRNFFLWAVREQVPLDLKWDNLRLRGEDLVLVDLLEQAEDFVDSFIFTTLQKNFCMGNTHIYDFLIEPLNNSNDKERYDFFMSMRESLVEAPCSLSEWQLI